MLKGYSCSKISRKTANLCEGEGSQSRTAANWFAPCEPVRTQKSRHTKWAISRNIASKKRPVQSRKFAVSFGDLISFLSIRLTIHGQTNSPLMALASSWPAGASELQPWRVKYMSVRHLQRLSKCTVGTGRMELQFPVADGDRLGRYMALSGSVKFGWNLSNLGDGRLICVRSTFHAV